LLGLLGISRVAPAAATARDPTVGPIAVTALQKAFARTVRESDVRKRAHVHTLHQSYATHHVLQRGAGAVRSPLQALGGIGILDGPPLE
jgi:site-specific recombinase XerC